MNLQTLLENLKTERNNLDLVIGVIESKSTVKKKPKKLKAKEIINGLRDEGKKSVHWSKKPGVDAIKLEKWRKKMAKNAAKGRASKNRKK